MYCFGCNTFFPDDEVVINDGDYGSKSCQCPRCGSDDIEKSETCKICGTEFVYDELANGFCLDCLWNAIDYETALEFMKDTDSLGTFLVTVWYDAGRLEHSSIEFNRFLEETFRRLVANDKFFVAMGLDKHDFLDACRYFCLPDKDKNDFGMDGYSFADWFYEKKSKKEEDKK